MICERIIANHGAACAVSSVPGEFSRFEIDFPGAADRTQSKKRARSEFPLPIIKEDP